MTFSATRIQSWLSCNRMASWKYIAGYPEPDTADTETGKIVHARLEDMGKSRRLPDLQDDYDAIAAEALPFIQPEIVYGTTKFEDEITFTAPGGRHRWVTKRDLRTRPGELWDYKTTGDFKWALTPDELLWDVQANLYAYVEFLEHPELQVCNMTWLYLRKRKPYAPLPVKAQITREHATRCFEALEKLADQMQAAAYAAPLDPVARHKHILQVIQPNFESCSNYRGCPHHRHCPDAPFISSKSPGDKKKMNLADIVAATSGAPILTAGNPHPMAARNVALETAPAAAAPAPAADINPPAARRPGRPAGSKNVKKPVATIDMNGVPTHVFADGTMAPVPPPPPPPPPAAVAPPTPVAQLVQQPAPQQPTTVVVNVTAPVTPANPTDAVIAAMAPKANDNGAQLAALLAQPPAAATPSPAVNAAAIGVLFVGCAPRATSVAAGAMFRDMVDTTDFDAVLREAKDMIGEAAYFTNFGYKTNGMLAEAVKRIVEGRHPAALVVGDPRTPEATLCLSYLRSQAGVVVEGSR